MHDIWVTLVLMIQFIEATRIERFLVDDLCISDKQTTVGFEEMRHEIEHADSVTGVSLPPAQPDQIQFIIGLNLETAHKIQMNVLDLKL